MTGWVWQTQGAQQPYTRALPTQWCAPLHRRNPKEQSASHRSLVPVDLSAVTKDVADLTGLLQAWSRGDAEALEQLAPLVHLELRGVARRMLSRERQADGWQPTDLVQESYVRLLDWRVVRWQNRAHFFATTAQDDAAGTGGRRACATRRQTWRRRGRRVARGPGRRGARTLVDVLALEDALTALATVDPRPSQVVELRFFGGFSVEETAEALGVSVRTVINDWNTARAWLRHELTARDAG